MPSSCYYIYLFILLISTATSLFCFDKNNITRIMSLYMLIVMLTEFLAYFFAVTFKNNYIIYDLFCPAQLCIILYYFNTTVDILKKRNWGIKVAFISMSLYISAFAIGYSKIAIFKYFTLYEGIVIISLSLISYLRMYLLDDTTTVRKADFWITTSFLIFWSTSYLYLGSSDLLNLRYHDFFNYSTLLFWLVECIYYLGFGTILVLTKFGKLYE